MTASEGLLAYSARPTRQSFSRLSTREKGLALFMIGAVATHVNYAAIGMIFVADAILFAGALVGWSRFPETWTFFGRGKGGGHSAGTAERRRSIGSSKPAEEAA